MTYTDRMRAAEQHQYEVADAFRSHGWDVAEFGTAMIPEWAHDAMKGCQPKQYLRWLPDLIAARDSNGVMLIECKSTVSKTANHAVELDCLATIAAVEHAFNVPVLIVWDDLRCNWPSDLRPVRYTYAEAQRSRGSGTPFCLIPKAQSRDLGQVIAGHLRVAS